MPRIEPGDVRAIPQMELTNNISLAAEPFVQKKFSPLKKKKKENKDRHDDGDSSTPIESDNEAEK